jgi:hypothetical protein
MTMMRIQSQIDTVILSLGSAPTLRRVDPYLQGCSLTPRAAPCALGRALLSGFDHKHRVAVRGRSQLHFDHAQRSNPAQRDRVAGVPVWDGRS